MSEILKRNGIMLCYPATGSRLLKWRQPFFSQPKLNGERCIVSWFKGEPILVSSYGNQFLGLGHIEKAIMELPHRLKYDGELYVHGWSREEIHSTVSRKKAFKEESKEMQFHIFDYNDSSQQQWERVDFLHSLKLTKPLFLVQTQLCTIKTWQEHCADYTDSGYEGAIYRQQDGIYSERRSITIAKFKPTFHDSYLITDVLEATTTETASQEAGIPLGMVGAFLVRGKRDRAPFKVGAGKLSHSERKSLWERHLSGGVIGSFLKVKHEKITTTNGIPVCCVALEVTNEDTEDKCQKGV